jgi:uncharacterized protein (TIGR02266 family)
MEDRRTILIVDDVPMFRELESVFVARCGRVLTAESGNEALALVERELPEVVVLDWTLPDMDGETFCRQLRSEPDFAHIVIIAITSSGDPEDHAHAIRAGAADVLSKPLSRTALVGAVSRFTRDGPARGLPRISLYTPVTLRCEDGRVDGRIRNLSRGGLFIETDCEAPLDSELEILFRLPETEHEVHAHVTVVWQRTLEEGEAPGLGARFLDLDRTLAGQLDDYVYEHGGMPEEASPQGPLPAGAPG